MLKGYAHIVDFFTSFEWWPTDPHDELVNNGAFCLADLGKVYAVYLPRGERHHPAGPRQLPADWFNPRTGLTTTLPSADGPAWTSPLPPDDGDWALLLQATRRPDEK